MIAYHVSHIENLQSIKSTMILSKGTVGNMPHKTGDGIYVWLDDIDIDVARDIADYLGFDKAILIKIDVDQNDLLADEDTLMFIYPTKNDLLNRMPEKAADIYMKWLDNRGGEDVEAVNDDEASEFKINLINKFKIKPNGSAVEVYNYTLHPARCIRTPIVLDILEIDSHEGDEGEDIDQEDLPQDR